MTTSNIITERGLGNILKTSEINDRENQKQESRFNRSRIKNKSDSDQISKDFIIDKTSFQLGKIQSSYTDINSVAKSIRNTDKEMENVEKTINRMQKELSVIVKRFPPFPPGSDERIKHLKSYDAYRKLIENLTFPKEKASENDTDAVHGGDRIPGLSESASDEEIGAALEFLDNVENRIVKIRKDLYEATENLLKKNQNEI